MLDETETVPLVLLSAPAGTGKTSLVADWVRHSGELDRTAWVTFEAPDEPFWPAVVGGLERLDVAAPPVPGHAAIDRQMMLSIATALARLPERVTLVIDGYELVDREMAADVDFLLRHSGHRLRLVFVTRCDPVLPLYRYRLEERVAELRIAELAFTDDEASELLVRSGVTLAPSSVRALNTRTGGWAVGLRFAARILATCEDPDQGVEEVTGDRGNIAEYLLGEVLNAQEPEVRELLLSTSVADTLQPGLTEELGGRSAGRTLALLTKANAFVEPVPEHPGFYRYHPFFRDMLRAELAFESPELMEDLQRRAAVWFAREGLLAEAVSHFVAIGAWVDAAAEIVDELAVGELLLGGTTGPVARSLGDLPEELVNPAVCIVRAVLALAAGDRERFGEQVDLAGMLVPPEPGPHHRAVSLTIEVLQVVQARLLGDPGATLGLVEQAEQTMSAPENRFRVERRPELVALVLLSRGDALARAGRLAEAYDAFAAGASVATPAGYESLTAEYLGHMAVLSCFGGQVTRAESLAKRSAELADGLGLPAAERPASAAAARAWIAAQRDDLRAASDHAAAAHLAAPMFDDPAADTLLTVTMASVQASRGDLPGALATVDQESTGWVEHDSWMADELRAARAHLLVANGEPDLALLEVADVRAERSERDVALVRVEVALERGDDRVAAELLPQLLDKDAPLVTQVGGWLLEASRQQHEGSSLRARSAVDRALRLAARNGLRAPFRHAAADVRKLLAGDPLLQAENPWLARSPRPGRAKSGRGLSPVRRAPDPDEAPVVEKLTSRELEVLGHLAELLTTEEIAATMFVSVNTIRTHVRSILRKLGVSRRNAAVRRARELDLLKA
jgi:LuxR family maltose regulon positive regulatory protein